MGRPRRPRRPRHRSRTLTLIASAVACATFGSASARAQTSITGSNLTLKNTSFNSATLSSTGYLGTYLTIPSGGATISLSANVSRGSSGAGDPRLNLVVADTLVPFNVASSSSYTTGQITLPAGTYVVRAERDYPGNVGVSRAFTINNLSVNTVNGAAASFSNSNNTTNALAAANTYIDHFRKGQASVAISGPGNIPVLGGTPVPVDLRRHAFNFGTAVAGFNGSTFLQNNPAPGSDNYRYQQAIKENFNAVVPENGGKWASNSSGSTPTTNFNISYSNAILNFADANGMRARMHNLIWGNQQPTWVNNLLASNPTTLRDTYIPHRIGYYVGDANDGNPNDDPARKYVELDVYNESVHTTQYWNAYGAQGVAGIYNEVAAAAASVGADVKLFTNEYNVLADNSDTYANWYRDNIEDIRDAGGAVTGVGIQYYANGQSATGNAAHNPARIQQTLQNLSAQGLSIALTEFGVKPTATQAYAAQVLSDTVPLVFGTPNATGFFMWGFWHQQMWLEGTGSSAFYNDDWSPTPVLAAWQSMMSQWDTSLAALADADGTIAFSGFYGDYFLRGQTTGAYDMTLTKGTTDYNVTMAAPPTWSLWNTAASGDWGAGANWSAGGIASAAGQTAYFGPAAAARTVNIDSPRTVGMLAFDSAHAYALGGGAVTLEGFDNAAGNRGAIFVAAGSHAINAPLVLADDTTVTVAPAASTLTIADLQPTHVALTKTGAGTLALNHIRAAALNVEQGVVKMLVDGGASGASNVASLSIATGATLDLADNKLITLTPAAAVEAMIMSGALLTSEADAAAGLTTIGVATGEQVRGLGPSDTDTFAGQTIGGASTIAMYTYAGDANLDGLISGDDYSSIDFNISVVGASGYFNGDFNYDGIISGDDYSVIDFNIVAQGAPFSTTGELSSVAAVPEPATLAGAGSAIFSLALCRRPRRRRRCSRR